jgi:uncharacterized membrane protein
MTPKNASLVRTAMASVLALGLGAAITTAKAADEPKKEQCAGVVKAGMNDCATTHNACHGHATMDGDSEAWIYVPAGTCDRILGARVVKVVDPTPKPK